MKKTLCLLQILLLTSWPSLANAQHQQAHVHGRATLSLALENTVLEMEFESPSANLLGFEHQARKPAEKDQVKHMLSILNQPEKLFVFVGSNCEIADFSLNAANLMKDEYGSDQQRDSGHSHPESAQQHDDDEHQDDDHREISASYRFNCKDTTAIKSVSTSLLKLFPGIEKMDVAWVSDTGQGGSTIYASNNSIPLR